MRAMSQAAGAAGPAQQASAKARAPALEMILIARVACCGEPARACC